MNFTIHDDQIFESEDYADKVIRGEEYQSCVFKKCNFNNTDLSNNRFVDCRFDGCNLSLIKLHGTTLNDVQFKNCKMLGVNFKDCTSLFFSVGFDGCILDYASFMDKKMLKTKFIKTSLKEANFSGANLVGSLFDETDLDSAVFNGTDLSTCNFITAYNYDIDPEFNAIKKSSLLGRGLTRFVNQSSVKNSLR